MGKMMTQGAKLAVVPDELEAIVPILMAALDG
jgi:hypothetical protein